MGKESMLQKLLAAGAKPNVADQNGEMPLLWAARKGNHPVMRQLLAAGARTQSVVSALRRGGYHAQAKELRRVVAEMSSQTMKG